MVEEINVKDFDGKTKEGKVLVDCYAPWCGPCRMLGPVIEEVAKENTEYKFYKLNVDDAEEVAIKFGIMSIPTILIFENGELKTKEVGFRSKSELDNLLK